MTFHEIQIRTWSRDIIQKVSKSIATNVVETPAFLPEMLIQTLSELAERESMINEIALKVADDLSMRNKNKSIVMTKSIKEVVHHLGNTRNEVVAYVFAIKDEHKDDTIFIYDSFVGGELNPTNHLPAIIEPITSKYKNITAMCTGDQIDAFKSMGFEHLGVFAKVFDLDSFSGSGQDISALACRYLQVMHRGAAKPAVNLLDNEYFL